MRIAAFSRNQIYDLNRRQKEFTAKYNNNSRQDTEAQRMMAENEIGEVEQINISVSGKKTILFRGIPSG